MTSVNIKDKFYFRFMQKGISAGKSEDEAIADIPKLINEELEKDFKEGRI